MRRLLPACVAALLLAASAPAGDLDSLPGLAPKKPARARGFADVASVSVAVDPPEAKPGQPVTVRVTVSPKPGCYTYPTAVPPGQLSRNQLAGPATGDVIFRNAVTDPPGSERKPSADDPGRNDVVYKHAVTWDLSAVVSPRATPGKKSVRLDGTVLRVCNEANCFNLTDPPVAELSVLDAPPVEVPAEFRALVEAPALMRGPEPPAAKPEPAPTHSAAKRAALPPSEYEAALTALRQKLAFDTADNKPVGPVRSSDLPSLLAAAWVWGWISLVTPCVFPMIPITISLFLKQSHQSTGKVVRLAGVYCLTIVAVLGASAVFLLSVFRELSVDPYMNLFLGGLFVFFALSLFGMYDIQLPGFLLRYTEKRRGAGGVVGTVFGALAFSIVSFTCVAPFLGGFAGMAAAGNFSTAELVLAGIVFATAFASPFFVFALFPSLLKKLPRSGGWMDTVKAVMGFLELAAAFKFFRSAEFGLFHQPEYFTYDFVMAGWIAISAAAGLYLLNLYRLPHDEEQPNIPVPRLLFGLGFLGLAVYLVPALWKTSTGENQRPAGVVYAWVDAFLLPDAEQWPVDLVGTVARVREQKAAGKAGSGLIFVDFTGEQCSNCRYNEQNVFVRPEVRDLLRQYNLVQMYTDKVPAKSYSPAPSVAELTAEARANGRFQVAAFGTEQLPLYAILEPKVSGGVRVVAVYEEGKINDVAGFVRFLSAPLGQP